MPIIKANALSEEIFDYFQIIISMPPMPPALIRQDAQIE